MKIVNDIEYFTIGAVAKEVGKLPLTIKRWYEWAEKNGQLYRLPKMRRDLDKKGTRYFEECAIPELIMFGENLKRGEMANFNKQFWGKRGKK